MANPWQSTSRAPLERRPTHLSVASLNTNASGLADSTISFGSEWTAEGGPGFRISQFPAPPSEIPTPVRSGFATPTSAYSAGNSPVGRFPPPFPNTTSPARMVSGSPLSAQFPPSPPPQGKPLPASPSSASYQDARSMSSVRTELPRVTPLKIGKSPIQSGQVLNSNFPSGNYPRFPETVASPQGSSRSQVSNRSYQKRPASPTSLAGASTIDWSDAASGISINPSEERLLSTSFITSLLSQTQEPRFAAEKPPSSWQRFARTAPKGDASSQTSGDGASTLASTSRQHPLAYDSPTDVKPPPSHQSVPTSVIPFYPSDLLSSSEDEPQTQQRLTPVRDEQPNATESRPVSADYSETLHSEEQVHSVVRSPSITFNRGTNARALGVMPAYRISFAAKHPSDGSNSVMTSDNSTVVTGTSISLLPPVHRPDAPRNVSGNGGFDADGVPRESEEDYAKINDFSFDSNRMDAMNSPALPSTAGTQSRFLDDASPGRNLRQSLQRNQSMRSVVSSVVSRISRLSHASAGKRAQYIAWLRKRPLPPLPPMPRNPPPELPHADEIAKSEEAIPLPRLAKRAEALQGLLDGGHLPAGSIRGDGYKDDDRDGVVYANDHDAYVQLGDYSNYRASQPSRVSRFRGQRNDQRRPGTTYEYSRTTPASPQRKRRRRLYIIIAAVVFGILLIAIPVGLAERKPHKVQAICTGNQTGVNCDLDATCLCTSTTAGLCKPLAKSLVDLVPDVNTLFAANFTASYLSDALFTAQGQPIGNLCSKQALLVDVAPNLDSSASPNRTKWAQAAIVWNLGMSDDNAASTNLQKFVSTAHWSSLATKDGPVTDDARNFAVNASGFTFDFAAQSVVPLSVSFESVANAPSAQIAEVSLTAGKVLDRMYSFALASSTQRQNTLMSYWTSTLQQQAEDLQAFIGAITSSSFILPFDATSSPGGIALTTLMANASSTPFPPPLACYPGLTALQLSRLSGLETTVFGLPYVSAPSHFDTSCFPDRPVYGVVDVLNLRLPFTDGRKGVALQGAVLTKDATLRTVLYSGEVLSALPGASDIPTVGPSASDPREFGTTLYLNHVLLNYLSSISNITLAMELVQFVLGSNGTPPTNPDLLNQLSSLPVLEFALFGSVTPLDIASSVSSFSTPSGSLFFGSDAGQTFRTWAITNSPQSIAWTQSSTSAQVVREKSTVDSNFESVWMPASQLVHQGTTSASDIQKVTQSLSSLGLFSSS